MAARDINKISGAPAGGKESAKEKKEAEVQVPAKDIALHYPKAVFLSELLADVASWSDFSIVMDPHLDRKMQIFAPRKMSKEEAFHVFVRSLETVGLRALHLEGGVVKIVPASIGTIAT